MMSVSNPAFLVQAGTFFFRYRNQLFPAFLIPLFIVFPPHFPGDTGMHTWQLVLSALAVAFVGQGFRIISVGLEYIRRGGLNKQVYADKLVTQGMFAHCRNPLYVGNLLLILSLFVITNNPLVYLMGGLFFLFAYISIVAAEEQYLHKTFGAEYEAYCQQVNRWLPDFRGFRQTLAETEFNWNRVFVKEYSSFYPWCLAILGVTAYGMCRQYPFEDCWARLTLHLILFVVATASFLGIRYLKKSGLLTEKAFYLPFRQKYTAD